MCARLNKALHEHLELIKTRARSGAQLNTLNRGDILFITRMQS